MELNLLSGLSWRQEVDGASDGGEGWGRGRACVCVFFWGEGARSEQKVVGDRSDL